MTTETPAAPDAVTQGAHRSVGAATPTDDPRATRWLWPLAGLAGGALAGLGDALAAVIRGVGGLGPFKGIWLLLLGASLLGVVGLIAGAATALVGRLVTRWRPAGRRRAAQIGAALVSLPLGLYDGVAMFHGHRAAQLPGHQIVSLLIALAGAALVYRGAGRFADLLARPPSASPAAAASLAARSAQRRRARATALALLAVAVGLHVANREVLPRLYVWFHTTLSILSTVLVILAARLWLGRRATASGAVERGRRLAVAAVLACAVVSGGFWQLRRSQILRFASYERTVIASLVLRAVPLSLAARTVAASERDAAEASLPPLPEGPRRPDADVVLITIDALRADHVGAYGYAGARRRPHRRAGRAAATRFERAYAQAPHTSFSVASMLTGKYFPTLARLAPGEAHDPIATVLRARRLAHRRVLSRPRCSSSTRRS